MPKETRILPSKRAECSSNSSRRLSFSNSSTPVPSLNDDEKTIISSRIQNKRLYYDLWRDLGVDLTEHESYRRAKKLTLSNDSNPNLDHDICPTEDLRLARHGKTGLMKNTKDSSCYVFSKSVIIKSSIPNDTTASNIAYEPSDASIPRYLQTVRFLTNNAA
jgi:hypothetical protein